MTQKLPYKIMPLKEAFPDYPGGAKAFLVEHNDFVHKPKDAFVVVVDDDFYSDIDGGHDLDDMFGHELDFSYDNDQTICAILFKKNCTIPNMCYVDREIEYAPALTVLGNLTARALNLAGGMTLINGDCNIREAIYGHYNHGELVVNGTINTPLIIADDYSMVLNGVVNTQTIIGTAWKTLAPKSVLPVLDDLTQGKQIKAVMDSFFMTEHGFDSDLISTAIILGDCVLKQKPANAKKRQKSDYYQLPHAAKAKLDALIAQKTPVTALQFGGFHMGEVPIQFKQFKQVTHIDLSNNSLKKLPDFLSKFSQLQHLDVSTNEVKKLPLTVNQLGNLHTLHIQDTLITEFNDNLNFMPNLTELYLGKKDWGSGSDIMGRLAIDFNWQKMPNLQHLHINETGWFWPWDVDFGFYYCKQLKYLHFGYLPRGKMGKQLSQLQQLEYYGFESDWQLDGDNSNAANFEIDIEVLAGLPHLQMLYITKDNSGITADTITALRNRLPNLYICAPCAKFGFAQDDSFEKLNTQFEKVQNYQKYEPKNEATVQKMLAMVQEHRLNISPKWFDKTWLHILMHLEGKARDCDDKSEKSKLVKYFLDVTQLLKPHIAKTASWTHLTTYGYDLWELVYNAEIWYALRREDHNATHLAWALEQLAIYLPIEQKQGHRQEFAGLHELALQLQTK